MDKTQNLNIIMLSNFDKNAGGRETWLYNFLPELLKDDNINKVNLFGYRLSTDSNNSKDILSLDFNINRKQRLFPNIIKVKSSRFPRALSMFLGLKKQKDIVSSSKDITLAVGVFETLMMLYIYPFKKTKKVVWLRSIFSHEKAYAIPSYLQNLFLWVEIKILKKADILICNGEDIKAFYKENGLMVNVIKNGVDVSKWNINIPKLKDPIQIAYIGRLSQVKGIESYLKLINKVKKSSIANKFNFNVVGNNGVYKDQVKNLENKKWLINYGLMSYDNLPQFLSTVDICVALTFASNSGGGGGTSNAMLEQMAASRIIIAWNNIIFNQYLNDENAYLVEQFSVDGLEKTLIEIYNNKKEAIQKSLLGHKTILPYSYKANVLSFKELVFNI